MILAIDMGNTNIVIGCIDSEQTYFVERVTTNHDKTGTEYAINIKNILEIHQIDPAQIDGAILSLSLIHISNQDTGNNNCSSTADHQVGNHQPQHRLCVRRTCISR